MRRRLWLWLRVVLAVIGAVLATMTILIVVTFVSVKTEFGRDGELFEWLGLEDRLPSTASCGALRSLRYGMGYNEVRQVLGDGYSYGPIDPIPANLDEPRLWPESLGRQWDYSHRWSPIGGLRLTVRFRNKKLVQAYVYVKTLSDELGRSIFELDKSDMYESQELQHRVCDSDNYKIFGRYGRRRFGTVVGAAALPLFATALLIRRMWRRAKSVSNRQDR